MIAFWLAFTTPPQKERAAQEQLRSRGLRAFVPIISKPKRSRNGAAMDLSIVPVLPGYVFVAFPMWQKQRYHVAKETKFVRGVILVDGKPGRIKHEVMEEFVHGLAKMRPVEAKSNLRKGAKVTITKGKFAELNGVVLHAGDKRAKILVQLFGRSCETLVDVSQLKELIVASTNVAAKNGKVLRFPANHDSHKLGRSVPLSGAQQR